MSEPAQGKTSPFASRVSAFAADAALALAVVELGMLLARAPGSRGFTTVLLCGTAALGAIGIAALPFAALLAMRPVTVRAARIALAGFGTIAVALALRYDAAEYVRLYGHLHALLGIAAVLGAVCVRAAFPVSPGGARFRAYVVALAAACTPLAMSARHTPRAYAAHRGVLLADAFWLTRADVHTLPPMPRTHPAGVITEPAPLPTRPQLVLMVTVDALRYDASLSPSFRGFAAIRSNGVRFANARAPAPWTVPSMYGAMTGRGPWRTRWTPSMFVGDRAVAYTGSDRNPRRVWPLPTQDRATTLAEALHAQGYQTRVCATLPFQVPSAGLTRGFDVVEQGVYERRNRNLTGTTSDLLTACGLAMIDAAAGAPLFLWLHYSDPHEPYAQHPELPIPNATTAARYAGEVAFVDRHVTGLLLNVAQRIGMQRTLVVFSADHGEEFGEHGGEYHAVTLYDEVAHVPFVIAAPGVPARDVAAPISLLDLAPTVLELVGAPPLRDTDGHSLVGLMRGGREPRRPVFAESTRYGRAVRSVVEGPFKLIYEARAQTYELFDLVGDPGEQLVVTDDYPEVTRALAQRIGVPVPR